MTEPFDQTLEGGSPPRIEPPTSVVPTPAFEATPGIQPTPTAPVIAAAPARRPSRARWAVAGVVALVVIALSAAGLFALVGASKTSVVAAWAPPDAVAFVEVRADLPGDQHDNLGRFLAHFPGFADQSTLDAKLDEALDKLVVKIGDGTHDWTNGIKPWFGGQVGLSVGPLPTGSAASAKDARALLIATQKDPAKALAWVKSLGGPAPTTESYKSATLQIVAMASGEQLAYTTSGEVLLVGDLASVRAALDRGGAGGLSTVDRFGSARATIAGDQALRAYVDVAAVVKAAEAAAAASGSTGGAGMVLVPALARLPDWLSTGFRFEGDALVATAVQPHPADAPKRDNKASTIAAKLPASTIGLVEVHDVGANVTDLLARLRKDPTTAKSFEGIDAAVKQVGGWDGLVGWIGDVGVVATVDGSLPGGGLVIIPTDTAKADAFVTQLKNLVSVAGTSSGITVRDEAYGDGTITIVDLGDAAKLLGGAGASGLPVNGRVELALTVQRGLAVIGVGDAFVKSVVDVKAGSSLADQARYKAAMERVGASNLSSVYLDLAGIRKLAEPFIALSPQGATYQKEVRPYLEPFDVFASAMALDGSNERTATVLTVINP